MISRALAENIPVRNHIEPIVKAVRKAIDVTQALWLFLVFDREAAALIRHAQQEASSDDRIAKREFHR
jgi:hypothetical protein